MVGPARGLQIMSTVPHPIRRHHRLRLVAAVVALSSFAAACTNSDSGGSSGTTETTHRTGNVTSTSDDRTNGGDTGLSTTSTTTDNAGSHPTTEQYADALHDGLMTHGGSSAAGAPGRCASERFVEILTTERIAKAGVTAEDLKEHGLSAVSTGGVHLTEADANDLFDVFDECDIDLVALSMTGPSTGSRAGDKLVACIRRHVTEEDLRASFVASARNLDYHDTALTDAVDACVPGSGGSGTSTPSTTNPGH